MKFGFVTCVQLGLDCINEIYRSGGSLDLLVTLRDDLAARKSGRIYLDDVARQHDVPLLKIRNVNDPEVEEAIRSHELDWLFIIGWSQIAKPHIIDAPVRGCLGIHPTLLPEGRGRAAIPWAIIKDLPETGVTMFKLDAGVDSGPVISQERVQIGERENATTLYDKMLRAHRTVIQRTWPALQEDRIELHVQDETKATYWPGRTPEDGRITTDMTVAEMDRLVRAVTHPYPGAFFDRDSDRLRIWEGHAITDDQTNAGPGVTITAKDGTFVATNYEVESAL